MKRKRFLSVLKNMLGKNRYLEWRNAWLFNPPEDPVMLQELPELFIDWPPASGPEGPVLLISPTQRSGSNYVHELLARHPVLTPLSRVEGMPGEFFFHTYAEAIKAYVEKTVPVWNTWYQDRNLLENAAHRLFAAMGSGMLRELSGDRNAGNLLLRAPDSRGIDHLFHLFPGARVVLLFRDGRDSCASFINSWGSRSVLTNFAGRWSSRVKEMLEFEKKAQEKGYGEQVIRITYEQAVGDPASLMQSILPKLNLPVNAYPFDKIDTIPLLGSSEQDRVHWDPVDKPASFNPIGRWKEWPEEDIRTFEKISGEALKTLGYHV